MKKPIAVLLTILLIATLTLMVAGEAKPFVFWFVAAATAVIAYWVFPRM